MSEDHALSMHKAGAFDDTMCTWQHLLNVVIVKIGPSVEQISDRREIALETGWHSETRQWAVDFFSEE